MATASRRVLIVSNRLPITVTRVDGALQVRPSTGGLATGLSGIHESGGSIWIGWPGYSEPLTDVDKKGLERAYRRHNVRPVALSVDEVERYYESFCNGVLWPLFHYFIGQLPLEVQDFALYESINRRFADAVVASIGPGTSSGSTTTSSCWCPG